MKIGGFSGHLYLFYLSLYFNIKNPISEIVEIIYVKREVKYKLHMANFQLLQNELRGKACVGFGKLFSPSTLSSITISGINTVETSI